MDGIEQDLRYAARSLARHWTITTLAVVSLAVAIGGNTAVFSMVDAFLFRPLPFVAPERLVLVGARPDDQPRNPPRLTASLPTWADLRERSRTLGEWAAVRPESLSLRGDGEVEAVTARRVTPGFFPMLGARVAAGRSFLPEEGGEGGRRVVVVSHALRLARFGDADPLGETLLLDGEAHEVVGALPPGWAFLSPGVDVWLPLARDPATVPRSRRDVFAVARITPGATMEAVRAEITGIATALSGEHPDAHRGWTLGAYNLRHDFPTSSTRILFWLLQGVVLAVLVIACVNLTNLLLARGQERQREVALRTALGASRGRIVRQLLIESVAIGLAGGIAGLVLGRLGIGAIARTFAGLLPATFTPTLNLRVLVFTAGISVGAGLLFALAPAVATLRGDHAGALREGGRGASRSRRHNRLSAALVVGEIAVSMTALGAGSVLVSSFLSIRSSDPGFDSSDLLVATITVPDSRYPGDDERTLLSARILQRARSVRGVRSATLVSSLPQGFVPATDSARLPGREGGGGESWQVVTVTVSPGYVEALDLSLLQGRFFRSSDRPGTAPVAVVDRALAEKRFPGESPLGRRIVVGSEPREIVGVVSNAQQTISASPAPVPDETVYFAHLQSGRRPSTLLVESAGDPDGPAPALRRSLRELDPDLALPTLRTFEEYMRRNLVGIRVFNVILTGFGIVALLLAALGTYGVLAYSVSRRRQEIGVRMAVGADPGTVVRMISAQGLRQSLLGLCLGGLATLPLLAVIRSAVRGFADIRPGLLLIIATVLFAATLLASWIPARRASRVDPAGVLRQE